MKNIGRNSPSKRLTSAGQKIDAEMPHSLWHRGENNGGGREGRGGILNWGRAGVRGGEAGAN